MFSHPLAHPLAHALAHALALALALALAFECTLSFPSFPWPSSVFVSTSGLSRSSVAAVISQVIQRSFQCESIGSLSFGGADVHTNKIRPLCPSVSCVRVRVCGSLFFCSLCSLSLALPAEPTGHARFYISYNWRPITGLNPRPDFLDHVAVFGSSLPSFQFFVLELASVVSFLYSTEYSQQRELLR